MDLDPAKFRRPSRGFGWVDNRIVSGGHLARLGQAEVPVYLVLCVVADSHGISYYHPATLARLVKHSAVDVRNALGSLAVRGLVAVQDRFVQVRDLEDAVLRSTATTAVKPPALAHSPLDDPSVEPAAVALQRVAEDVRQDALRQALDRMRPCLGQREPSASVLHAIAVSILREEGKL